MPSYGIACVSSAGKQERQAELYNKKVSGKPHDVGSLVWQVNPQVPWEKSKKTAQLVHGQDHTR